MLLNIIAKREYLWQADSYDGVEGIFRYLRYKFETASQPELDYNERFKECKVYKHSVFINYCKTKTCGAK